MNKKLIIIVIIVLLGINMYTLVNFYQYKNQSRVHATSLLQESEELSTLKLSLSAEIENSDVSLTGTTVKDSLNNRIPLLGLFKDGQSKILVCRFSELNCESCVDHSIQTLLQWVDSIGKDNILFLGAYRNNNIFNKLKPVYHIDALQAANTTILNLPVEKLGFPYYFILDSAMRTSNVFVPDKATPRINKKYLELITERYFKQKK